MNPEENAPGSPYSFTSHEEIEHELHHIALINNILCKAGEDIVMMLQEIATHTGEEYAEATHRWLADVLVPVTAMLKEQAEGWQAKLDASTAEVADLESMLTE